MTLIDYSPVIAKLRAENHILMAALKLLKEHMEFVIAGDGYRMSTVWQIASRALEQTESEGD